MQYKYSVSINSKVLDLIKKIESDTLIDTNEATLIYYATRLIAEIDRLVKAEGDVSYAQNIRIRGLVDYVQGALDKLNSKLHHTEYFKELGDDHEYVKLLENFRNKGVVLDDALTNIAIQSGTPRTTLLGFIKGIDYPRIVEDSKEFSLGKDLAMKSYDSTIDSMYKVLDELDLSKDKVNNFIAGFLSIKPLSNYDNEVERIKNKINQYNYKTHNADEILIEYDKYLRR